MFLLISRGGGGEVSGRDKNLVIFQETIESLCDEIKEDYLLSVKKAIVDFVLNDPSGEQGACGAGGIQGIM